MTRKRLVAAGHMRITLGPWIRGTQLQVFDGILAECFVRGSFGWQRTTGKESRAASTWYN